MYKLLVFTGLVLFVSNTSFSQMAIGTPVADESAIMELKATNKGFLPPRVTAAQKALIPSPKAGLLVYQTDGITGLYVYNGTTWIATASSGSSGDGFMDLSTAQTAAGKKNFVGQLKVNDVSFGYGGSGSGSNVAAGNSTLSNNSTGSNNTGVGYQSLLSNTTAEGNTGVGYQTLYANKTAHYNTANGAQTLYANTEGTMNTASGYQALYSNIDGSDNTANGFGALFFNKSGDNNTASGFQSLLSNTIGFNNTATGAKSLLNSTGFNNTALGVQALYSNTTGNKNTAVGVNALYSNISGSENSALGYKADVATNNISNATAIGARAQVACSNCMVLGSVAGANGATAGTNVGIGTVSPQMRLHVSPNGAGSILLGTSKISGGYTALEMRLSSQSGGSSFIQSIQSAGSAFGKLLLNPSGGNVGINLTTESLFPLDINQKANAYALRIIRKTDQGEYQNWDMFSQDGEFYFSFNNVRSSYISSANGSYYEMSDSRFKTQINKLDNVLDKVMALQPKTYQYIQNEENSRYSTGFLAQEVQPLFPELVSDFQKQSDDKSTESIYHGINYAGLGVIAIRAIQEQQQQIKLLTIQNNTLMHNSDKLKIAEQQKEIEKRQDLINKLKMQVEKLEQDN